MELTTEAVKFQRKELELKALLEITQAINENKSESVLLNIYKFTTLVHLNIKSLVLYVANREGFEARVSHGVKENIHKMIPHKDVEDNKEMGKLSLVMPPEYSFSELDFYIPVYHKDKMLAILLLRANDVVSRDSLIDNPASTPELATQGLTVIHGLQPQVDHAPLLFAGHAAEHQLCLAELHRDAAALVAGGPRLDEPDQGRQHAARSGQGDQQSPRSNRVDHLGARWCGACPHRLDVVYFVDFEQLRPESSGQDLQLLRIDVRVDVDP
jgi:hypothetical protein